MLAAGAALIPRMSHTTGLPLAGHERLAVAGAVRCPADTSQVVLCTTVDRPRPAKSRPSPRRSGHLLTRCEHCGVLK